MLFSLMSAQEFTYPVMEDWQWSSPLFVVAGVLFLMSVALGIYMAVTKSTLDRIMSSVLFVVLIVATGMTFLTAMAKVATDRSIERFNLLAESIKENYGAEVLDLRLREGDSNEKMRQVDSEVRLNNKTYACVVTHDTVEQIYSVTCIDGEVIALEKLGKLSD